MSDDTVDFIRLGVGSPLGNLLYLRVCTTLDDTAAEARANLVEPAGTTHGWRLCTEANQQPVECADDPTRRHLMFKC